jgi:predicted nucleic acid-binding protein
MRGKRTTGKSDPKTQLQDASTELSKADVDAISLARECRAVLLMDDRRARQAAALVGVTTIGTVGLLEAASARGILALPEAFERLRQTNIFLT